MSLLQQPYAFFFSLILFTLLPSTASFGLPSSSSSSTPMAVPPSSSSMATTPPPSSPASSPPSTPTPTPSSSRPTPPSPPPCTFPALRSAIAAGCSTPSSPSASSRSRQLATAPLFVRSDEDLPILTARQEAMLRLHMESSGCMLCRAEVEVILLGAKKISPVSMGDTAGERVRLQRSLSTMAGYVKNGAPPLPFNLQHLLLLHVLPFLLLRAPRRRPWPPSRSLASVSRSRSKPPPQPPPLSLQVRRPPPTLPFSSHGRRAGPKAESREKERRRFVRPKM